MLSFILTLVIIFCTHCAASHTGLRQSNPDFLPNGIWTFRGYGYVVRVVNDTATLFEETAISCILNPFLLMGVTGHEVEGNVANLTVFRFVPYFVLDRSESFQSACANGITPVIGGANYTRDALVDFDILNQTFVENYAHFDNRLEGGIMEWDMRASEARANLTADSTDNELVSEFQSMLIPLDDYHVWVKDEFGFLVMSHGLLWEFQEEFHLQNAISDWETYQQTKIFTPWFENAAGYMADGLTVESSGLAWGHTNENIGYMWLRTIPNDAVAFAKDFEAALLALQDTDTLVFDIRVNQGGSDATALLIASHFASEPFLAFTKQAVGGDSDAVKVFVEPSEIVYNGTVVMIISGSTYSAAETLPLAMMQLPQTMLLGRNTGGSYSELPKSLPNGWAFSLFSEVYLSSDGIDYDNVGIPPDILPPAELLPLSEREGGIDSWLELALKTVNDTLSNGTNDIPLDLPILGTDPNYVSTGLIVVRSSIIRAVALLLPFYLL